MAEFIFRSLSPSSDVSSSGVSGEELGNDMYPPAKRVLMRHGIPFSPRKAKRISDEEFRRYDLIVAMDSSNRRALERRFGRNDKIIMLLDRDVADPWYTDDFETAFSDIMEGCRNLLEKLAN